MTTQATTNRRAAKCATCRATVPAKTGSRIDAYRPFTLCPTCAAVEDAIAAARPTIDRIAEICNLHIIDLSILRQALRKTVPAAEIATVIAQVAAVASPGLSIYQILSQIEQARSGIRTSCPHAHIATETTVTYSYGEVVISETVTCLDCLADITPTMADCDLPY